MNFHVSFFNQNVLILQNVPISPPHPHPNCILLACLRLRLREVYQQALRLIFFNALITVLLSDWSRITMCCVLLTWKYLSEATGNYLFYKNIKGTHYVHLILISVCACGDTSSVHNLFELCYKFEIWYLSTKIYGVSKSIPNSTWTLLILLMSANFFAKKKVFSLVWSFC